MDETLPRLRGFVEKLRRALPWLAAVAALGGTVWTSAGGWHWTGEAAADYRWHLGWACFALGGTASMFRSWVPTGVLLALAAVHLWPELRLSVPQGSVAAAVQPISVGLVTLDTGAVHEEEFLAWMEADPDDRIDHRPDVLFVTKLDPESLGTLDVLAERGWTTAQLWPPREQWDADTRGSAVIARVPIGPLHAEAEGALLSLDVELEGEQVPLIACQMPRPLSAEAVERRAQLVALVAERAARSPRTVVLAKLSATGYSPAFAVLARDGGLTDSRNGFGRQTSWADDRFLPGLELAVDHVLVGDGIAVLDRDVEDLYLGSGHQPVVCRLVLR